MKSFVRSYMTGAIALAIAGSLVGCSVGGDKPASPAPAPAQQTGADRQVPGAQQVEQGPDALQVWVNEQGDAAGPNSAVIEHEGQVYLAVTGGLQNSGGYLLVLDRVETMEGGARVFVKLKAPEAGSINITALVQPVGYFQLANVSGKVVVNLSADAGVKLEGGTVELEPVTLQNSQPSGQKGNNEYSENGVSAKVEWVDDNTLNIQGKANVPDLQFVVKAGNKPLAQGDTTVKEGQYIANLIVQGGAKMDLELNVVDPNGGKVLLTVPLLGATK